MPKATFESAPGKGAINFGIGQPSDDLLPVALFRSAMDAFLETAVPRDFNYGDRQGDPRFRASLARFLGEHHGTPVAPEALFLTNGNSHALDFICHRFTRPGDTVFVEEPSYFLAFQVFRDHGLKIVGIPVDEGGMSIDRLEAELSRVTPALVYTIPSYNNPSGTCDSASPTTRCPTSTRGCADSPACFGKLGFSQSGRLAIARLVNCL